MRKNWHIDNWRWLTLSSLITATLTACPAPTQQASFSVTGQAPGESFVDGSRIQPLEATVRNLSDFAGTPPEVSFNITQDLDFVSVDSALYTCATPSQTLLLCTAKDGAKLEGQAQVILKPIFDLAYKNSLAATSGAARVKPQGGGLIEFPISIGSSALPAPITFSPRGISASATNFDLMIGKSVSKPFILGANGGTGEFTLTASLIGTTLPGYVKIQDPPLPTGYSYDIVTTNANNTAWTCVSALFLQTGISCTLKPPVTLPSGGVYPPLKITVKMNSSVTTAPQLNCSYVLPNLGELNATKTNNNQGPSPYTVPCTPYKPIRTDLAIVKTQIAPITNPANSFYWGLPGKYQIVVSNNTLPAQAVNGPFSVTDVLSSTPTGTIIAFTQTAASMYLAADGWTITSSIEATNTNGWSCAGLYPVISCWHPGPIAAGGTLPPLILGVLVKPANPALANSEDNCASLPSDANNSNNQSCATSQNQAIEPFDVKITKTTAGQTGNPAPGSVVNYALLVQNIGGADAAGPITVTDTLPSAFSSATATTTPANAATCTVAFPTIQCVSSGSLPAGASFTVNIAATSSATATGTITNTASVVSYFNAQDSSLTNNTSSIPVTFTPAFTLNRAESVVQAPNGDFIAVGSSDSATRRKQFAVRRYASDGATVIWTKIEDFSAFDDTALDVALDSAGDIVVVGRANLDSLTSCDTQAVLTKYAANGTTLAGFPQFTGTTTDLKYDYFSSVAVDNQKRIVTGGSDANVPYQNCGGQSESRFVLHRFTTAGIADNGFGTAGRVESDVATLLGHTSASYGSFVGDVLIEEASDLYRIYAAGSTPHNQVLRVFAIARYTTTGTLDTAWGASGGSPGVGVIETNITNGAINTLTPSQDSVIREIGIQLTPTGKRLVATGFGCGANDCSQGIQSARSCVVTRYGLFDGAVDSTFGSAGAASFGASNTTNGSECNAMAINGATNEIAVSGSSFDAATGNGATGTNYMARILGINGTLGTLYGSDNPNLYGSSVIPVISPRADRSYGVTWTVAGSLMTVGYSDKDATDKDEWVVKGY